MVLTGFEEWTWETPSSAPTTEPDVHLGLWESQLESIEINQMLGRPGYHTGSGIRRCTPLLLSLPHPLLLASLLFRQDLGCTNQRLSHSRGSLKWVSIALIGRILLYEGGNGTKSFTYLDTNELYDASLIITGDQETLRKTTCVQVRGGFFDDTC
ncbi:hypothetical protein VNO77_23108 [Canavalia gladiata]|uniref:Uncharacterized protein n=1 Tax=Canavalia gladiata TaxID=3824 RepID=A0AAN9QF37_CANGL